MNSIRPKLKFTTSRYGVGSENDSRLRQDLKKHNWLLKKLVTRLRRKEAIEQKIKMKKSTQIPKSAPKVKPSLPISIPIVIYKKYLEKKEKQKQRKQSEVKPKTNKKDKNLKDSKDKVSKTSLNKVKNCSQMKENLADNNHVRNKETTKIKKLNTVTISKKNTRKTNNIKPREPKKLVTAKKLKVDNYTQTDNQDLTAQERDLEILTIIKRYGFTKTDLDIFYHNLRNNNNQQDFRDFNEINDDKDETNIYEIISDDQSVEENNDLIIIEDLSNTEKATESNEVKNNVENEHSVNAPNKPKENKYEHSNLLSKKTLHKLRACSDLNKLVLCTFYEGLHLAGNKTSDKLKMHKDLSELSNSLVDKIYNMFTEFVDSNGKHFGRVTEIIELDNEECEVLPPKTIKKNLPPDLNIESNTELVINNNNVAAEQQQNNNQQLPVTIAQNRQNITLPPTQTQHLQHIPTEQQGMQRANHSPTNMQIAHQPPNCPPTVNQTPRSIPFPDAQSVRPAYTYNRDPRLAGFFSAPQQARQLRPQQDMWYDDRNIQQHYQRVPQNNYHLQQQRFQFQQNAYGMRMQQQMRNKTFEQMMQQQDIQYTPSNSYTNNLAQR